MTKKKLFTFLLALLLVVVIIFQAFRWYLFSDDTPLIKSISTELNADKLMIVFAHPDDESYTTQLLTDAEYEGVETALLTFTPGDAGEQQPVVCQQEFLGDIRKAEVLKSGFLLGVDYQKVYDYGDGTLIHTEMDSLVNDIVKEIQTFQPDLIVTFWPESGMTMHEDHRTIGIATQKAIEKYREENPGKKIKIAYTIMPPQVVSMLGHDEMNKLQPTANYSIKAKASIKTRLWDIHASQGQFVKNYTGLPDWLLYRLLNREYYFVEQ